MQVGNKEPKSKSLNSYYLTPNRPLVHTSFTYPKLNMDGFSLLSASLGYEDNSQEVKWNSLHAERGIGKGEGSGIMPIR